MISRTQCTGCSACYNVCPINAISMKLDIGGFSYPEIDNDRCLKCGLCDKVCDEANNVSASGNSVVFGVKLKDEQIRSRSTSGGAFYNIAAFFLNKGGVIYGAAYGEDFSVRHVKCNSLKQLLQLHKSKYVQSDLNNIFKSIISDLRNGKYVLFSGTACQCSGLISMVSNMHVDMSKLYTCDFVCHGVPSPRIWQDYLLFRSRKGEIQSVDFRNKDRSWRDFRMSIKYKGKKKCKIFRQNEDYFMILFFHNLILRKSCYSCKYTSTNRKTDFTLGDFWGVEKFHRKYSDDKGISLIMFNSNKAKAIIKDILENTRFVKSDLTEICYAQPNLKGPTKINSEYQSFWKDYDLNGFDYIIKKYADATIFGRIKRKYIFKLLYYTGIFKLLIRIKYFFKYDK